MTDEQFKLLLKRVAAVSITNSTIRSQGPKGTMQCARNFLADPQLLEELSKADSQKSFYESLNSQTEKLRKALPKTKDNKHGGYWGTARKCLNIFLFECVLNRHLYKRYNLAQLKPWLEVPLDSLVGKKLRENNPKLPVWDAIKRLNPDQSELYQSSASQIAKKKDINRVYLDLEYWGSSKDSDV